MQDAQAPVADPEAAFQKRRQAMIDMGGFAGTGPNVGNTIGSVAKGVARGLIQGVGSIGAGGMRVLAAPFQADQGTQDLQHLREQVGMAARDPGWISTAEDNISQFARNTFPPTEAIEKAGGAARFFAQSLPEFLGGAIPYLAGGEIAGGERVAGMLGMTQAAARKAAPILMGALAAGESGYRDAKASGADEGTAMASFALNAGVGGATMGLGPIPEILSGANQTTGGMFIRALQGAAAMSAQSFASDAIAEQLYTDEKRISVQKMLEQGALGGLSSVFLEGLHKAYAKVVEPPKPPARPTVSELPAEGPKAEIPLAPVKPGKMPAAASPARAAEPAPVPSSTPAEAAVAPAPTAAAPEPRAAPEAAAPQKALVGHPAVGPTEIELSDGRTMRAGYAVVEASSLQPSHLPAEGFKVNPLGDKNERPYDYPTEGMEIRAGVRARAESLKPAFLLSDTPSAMDGPPIVKGDGTVLGGNGRTMSMQMAYGSGKAEAYRAGVTEWAQRRGMDISSLKEPVLVRVVSDADAGKPGDLSRMLNEGHAMGKTLATESVSRGSKIDIQAAQEIAALIGEGQNLRDVIGDPGASKAVLSTLVRSGAITQKDIMGWDDGGKLSEVGKQEIENALLGAAIPDVYALRGAPAGLRQSVFKALPGIVRARGAWPEMATHLSAAIEALTDASRQGTSIDEARRQATIESRPWKDNQDAVALAKAMEGRGQKQMRQLFSDLSEALTAWKSGQATLLGPAPKSALEAFWSTMHDLGIQGTAKATPPGDATPNDGQIAEFFGRPGQEFIDASELDPKGTGSDQAADPILGGASEEIEGQKIDDELARPKDPFGGGAIGTPIGYRDMTGELSSMGQDWDGQHVPFRQEIVKGYAHLLEIMGKTGATFRQRRIGTGKEAKLVAGVFYIRNGIIRLARDGDISTAPHEFAHALEKTLFGIDMRKGNPFGASAAKDLPLQNKALIAELQKLGTDLYGPDCAKEIVLREGWAEFWREWFNKPETIAKIAPELTNWVEGPEIFGKWPELAAGAEAQRNMIDAWRRAGGLLRIDAQIKHPQDWLEKKQDIIDRVKAWSFYESFVEVGGDLQRFQKTVEAQYAAKGAKLESRDRIFDVYDMVRMSHGPVAAFMVGDGHRGYTFDINGNKTGLSLTDSLRPAEGGGRALFDTYLVSKRAVAWWTDPLGKRDPGVSIQDARAALEDIQKHLTPQQFAGFEIAQKNVEEWFANVNRYGSQMSDTYAHEWKSQQDVDARRKEMSPGWEPFYVPLRRADLGPITDSLKGFSSATPGVRSGILKAAHGSGKRVISPLWQSGLEAERRIQGAHNFAVIDAARRLERVAEDAGDLLVKVPTEFFKSHAPTYSELLDNIEKSLTASSGINDPAIDIRALLEQSGVDPRTIEDGLGDRMAMFSEKPPGPNGQPTVALWNAETRKVDYYELTPGMQKALTGMDPYRLKGGLAFLEHGLFQVPKQIFTMGTTGMRMTFSYVTNPIRDIQSLYLNTASGKSARWLAWTWAKTMRGALSNALAGGKEDWAMEFLQKSGVSMMTPLAQDTKQIDVALNKAFGKKDLYHTVTGAWEWTKEFMQIPELVSRATEVKAVADAAGWSPGKPMTTDLAMDLALASKRVTTNFTAAGDVARAFNRIAPFFNASIQGPYASWKAARRNPASFAMRGMSMAASSAALWLLIKDQDWYKELAPREKYSYWHVPAKMFGQDVVWRVPMSHEIGTLFGALPMAMLDALHEEDPQAALDWAGTAVQQAMPNVMPVLMSEALEQASNRDFFSGMPIVPRGQEDVPAEEQFGDYTTRASMLLGKLFGWSPRRIDHAIRGTAGSASIDLLAVAGGRGTEERKYISEVSDVPVAGSLFQRGGQAGTQPRTVTDVYDLYGEYFGRSRSTRNPEAAEDRQRRLRLQDATQAISALTWVRAHTAEAGKRSDITNETVAIAKEALTLVRGADVYNPGNLGWKAQQAKRLKDSMLKHPEWQQPGGSQ